jgi:hypothetical protein
MAMFRHLARCYYIGTYQEGRRFEMSWDVFVQDLPQEARNTADIPSDFRPASIGKRSAIIEKIREVFPAADFSDPSWSRIDGDDWSIEVNFGANEDCAGFALHIRGGDAGVGAVDAILQRLHLRALDAQTGNFFKAGPESIDSFRKWRAYRDQCLKTKNKG